ncbi:MAG: ABC transporter permease [Syntrophobacter sp.]
MSSSPQEKQGQDNFITGHMRESVKARYREVYFKQSQELKKEKRKQVITGFLGGVTFLFVWYVCSQTIMDKLPSPWDTLVQSIKTVSDPWYYKSVYHSLFRVLLGFCTASALAIPLGLMMGWNRIVRDMTMPGFELFRSVPPVAWVPLSIIIFANMEYSIVFITFTGAFFVVALNAKLGAESIDQSLFRAAWCLGGNPRQIFRHILLPGALPSIFMGLALGMGIAWQTVVAAEMIAGQYGLGYLAWESYSLIRFPEVILAMTSIGVLGYACSAILRGIANKYLAWRKVYTA